MPDPPRRVHVAIAHAGAASRRAAERLVAGGKVLVNGVPATIGQLVTAADTIVVDGTPLGRPEPFRTFIVNKAAGVVCTASDPQGRHTILDDIASDVRLYSVGRLDIDTTGAILVTNDGELANRLMHPSSGIPKVYEALVEGRVSADTVRVIRSGMTLDDGPTRPCECDVMDRKFPQATWLRIAITEGRNRQVRRMCAAVGHPAVRLHRPAYAGIPLRGLRRGEWRPLTPSELRHLARRVGLER